MAAAARFYRERRTPDDGAHQWLVDTPQRLAQYRDLAPADLQLGVSLEIDVGLHRGGIADTATMDETGLLRSEPRCMGRMMVMTRMSPRFRTLAAAITRHRPRPHHLCGLGPSPASAEARTTPGADVPTPQVRPPTVYTMARASERAVGGFGHRSGVATSTPPLLADLAPAVFIATPCSKALEVFQMPYGVQWLGALARGWDHNQAQAYFIYGGNWLADPGLPKEGLAASGLYGTSSKQVLRVQACKVCSPMIGVLSPRARVRNGASNQFGDIAVRGDHLTDLEGLPAA